MTDTLKALALKYETKEFLVGDPSWFMHQVEGDLNKELLAFIASALSYGSRKQFLPKIESLTKPSQNLTKPSQDSQARMSGRAVTQKEGCLLVTAPNGGNYKDWLISGDYNKTVPPTDECFYRLYTYRTFNTFLTALAGIVSDYGSLKGLLKTKMHARDALEAISFITTEFENRGSKGVIPAPPLRGSGGSSCKRVCMFLRWMVRDNSPVDLGLWSDIIDKRTLIIPMDTHVVQESLQLGLLSSKSTSMANARKLSARLAEIFPDDPIKGDFALFGLGVDNR